MTTKEYDEMTLDNIGHGAALEFFERDLKKVLENIRDPNMNPATVRKITIEVSIKPNADLETAGVQVKSKATLAQLKPAESAVFLGADGKAYQSNLRQQQMFDAEGKVKKLEPNGK